VKLRGSRQKNGRRTNIYGLATGKGYEFGEEIPKIEPRVEYESIIEDSTPQSYVKLQKS